MSEASKAKSWTFKTITWVLAAGCFYLVYTKIVEAGLREGLGPVEYLVDFFAGVEWWQWLALMIPYSIFFFMVDAHATWRVIRWFNVPSIKYTDILPIRGSAYILSMVNEQVGKGAMSLYLLRRHDVPGWEALSSMIFLALAEIYQRVLNRIELSIPNVAYNCIFHSSPFDSKRYDHYHWHIEVIPRIATLAGLEIGAKTHVNIVKPEQSAKLLKRLQC